MNDLTIVYYTSCAEDEQFESKIKSHLWATVTKLGLPLISVSQKPIDFGDNICVGEVGSSSQNAWRQLQIGAAAAKTEFVCPAESDFLYPPSYFAFRPVSANVFCTVGPVYILYATSRQGVPIFKCKPKGSEGAMMVGRDLLIKRIDTMYKERGQWKTYHDMREPRVSPLMLHWVVGRQHMELEHPVVTFKTDRQLHNKHPVSSRQATTELPHWGNAKELWDAYCR